MTDSLRCAAPPHGRCFGLTVRRGLFSDRSVGLLCSAAPHYFLDCLADEPFSAAPTVPQLPEFMS